MKCLIGTSFCLSPISSSIIFFLTTDKMIHSTRLDFFRLCACSSFDSQQSPHARPLPTRVRSMRASSDLMRASSLAARACSALTSSRERSRSTPRAVQSRFAWQQSPAIGMQSSTPGDVMIWWQWWVIDEWLRPNILVHNTENLDSIAIFLGIISTSCWLLVVYFEWIPKFRYGRMIKLSHDIRSPSKMRRKTKQGLH